MPSKKFRPHKGVLKRVRVTRNGRIKRRRAGLNHRCSHKSGHKVRQLGRPAICPPPEEKRLRALIGSAGR